ncbi:uncharacterized protein CcaverHIS019_0212710 [Cutaneotrichosporon cavernicola]|uniref:Flavoprotein domain-containing protein n=1 Tax=Cutaneotrichosporon cavernicola TaxID=279322 RepID=A0AA48I5A6_9TREE|nr:uncharacterized protein CcaverHIS019_0212710 [Cutaneotrichosporon cavernicola]BEI89909.1 hypothetical protein CcaverHIS019_0212710 [Cutaneotrichosporon cavernicola]BEI97680.1 hypothetical protein CcaverHIS631_0212690 [Cutaneotrichosporon cavernicola]BEJ05457.1 hypothetical protein CcaverHIS641_0212740 [Cutaneotrichosporon cavernicola]
MSSRLEATSAILGEYMLKGWTLTDLVCRQCQTTPLMRQPAAEAQREGRAPIQFCASCDGGPSGASASSPGGASQYESAASQELSPPSTPTRTRDIFSLSGASPTPPPASHAASAVGDPDAAADAISDLLLKGYALLSSTCPESTCRGIPLVGFPRRRDGSNDPRRECVSCGQRWVDEKDLAASGLRVSASVSSAATSLVATPTPARAGPPLRPATPSETGDEAESPQTRARRELYDQGNAIMQARADADAMKKAEEEALKMAGLDGRGMPLVLEAGPSTLEVKSKRSEKKKKDKGPTPSIRSRPFASDDHRPASPDGKLRVVLVTTGSVASIKMPLIVEALGADANVEVQVVATGSSLHFYDSSAIEAAHDGVGVWADADEWSDWKKIGDPILHIELRRWADLVVVVPCSADMLAKIAGGICDNLALSMLRALDGTPVVLCPAMNTFMYSHPLTQRHVQFLKDVLGYHILGPQGADSGRKLACGDVGAGKMTEWTDIVSIIRGYAALARTRTRSKKAMNATLRTLLVETEMDGEDEIANGNGDVVVTKEALAPAVTVGQTKQLSGGIASGLQRPAHALHALSALVLSVLNGTFLMPVLHVAALFLSALFATLAAPLSLFRFLLTPLLILLHVVFTLSSITLRVFQTRSDSPRELTKRPPSHVALILVDGGDPQLMAVRFVESVRRAILWAAEWGVHDVSVWDTAGLGVRFHSAVTHSLLNLPPSPPSSSASPRTSSDAGVSGHVGDDTVASSVYVNSPTGPRRVEVHFLAPSATDTVTRVTRRLAADGVHDIDQATLDAAIKADLRLPSDPELAIIHDLSPPGFLRGLLPRPAPELHGFPAWLLRITEIYAHPPRLPLQVPFVGKLLHNSPLPILRKFGASFPSSLDEGVLDSDEWEGAQAAWEGVDQRRGK